MYSLIDALKAKFGTDLAAAKALGMTRQNLSAARARGFLSNAAALRAAELLWLEPGAALLANATGKDPSPPVQNTTPETAPDGGEPPPNNKNYAYFCVELSNTQFVVFLIILLIRKLRLHCDNRGWILYDQTTICCIPL